jgi:hypothetical protein
MVVDLPRPTLGEHLPMEKLMDPDQRVSALRIRACARLIKTYMAYTGAMPLPWHRLLSLSQRGLVDLFQRRHDDPSS